MATALGVEVTLELLEDLAKANRAILADLALAGRVTVRVEARPRPRLIIEFVDEADGYRNIIPAKAVLRPTNYGRRLLGLPEKQEAAS